MTITCRLAHGGQPIAGRGRHRRRPSTAPPPRASLSLQVVDVLAHGYRRRTERLSISSAASLRALICERVVTDEVIPVTLTDLSDAGCAVTLTDSRPREGDRMMLTARFLEGEVTADVRIVRITLAGPDVYTVGCYFICPSRLAGRARAGARPCGRQRPPRGRSGCAARLARRGGERREFAQAGAAACR